MPNLYLITSLGGNPARDHKALYLEAPASPSHAASASALTHGTLFHVTGTIATGMTYISSALASPPSSAPDFLDQKCLGVVSKENVDLVDEVCRGVVPPEKQFEGFRRIDKGKKLRRCGDWVEEVLVVLRERGVLVDAV